MRVERAVERKETKPSGLALGPAFRALGDEKRLRILARLCGGERCVCELALEVGAKQPLLSFHLKTLREAGLVQSTRHGRWIYYTLNDEALRELASFLAQLADLGSEAAEMAEAGCC